MIVITGGGGMVGSALATVIARRAPVEVSVRTTPGPPDIPSRRIELSDDDAVRSWFAEIAPEVVIHTAYSTSDLERDVVEATGAVAAAAAAVGARLVLLSTDAVFDGENGPFTEADPPSPVHAYGRAKRDAEDIARSHVPDVAIVRISLIVSRDPLDGFSRWLVDATSAGDRVRLFSDEYRNVIRLEDVIAALDEIAALADHAGVWHLGGPERLSRPEMGERLAAYHGLDLSSVEIVESPTDGPPRPRDIELVSERIAHLSVRPAPICSIGAYGETRW